MLKDKSQLTKYIMSAITCTLLTSATLITAHYFQPTIANAESIHQKSKVTDLDIDIANNTITILEDANRELKKQVLKQHTQLDTLKKDNAEQKKRADEAEKKLKDLETKNKELQEQVNMLTAQTNEEATTRANSATISDAADLIISQSDVDAWGQKIDKYLAGTVLDGQGHTFAQAAADFGVDPRLSPAISTIESGAGAALAADHNAWGWGGPGNWASWPDWETAIRAHVKGLKENGYMPFDQEAGTRYCDSNYWSVLKSIIEDVNNA